MPNPLLSLTLMGVSHGPGRKERLDRVLAPYTYPAGASPYGAYDLAGNVWEWVADWYAIDYYQRGLRKDPKGPDRGTMRVRRGGAWDSKWYELRTSYREHETPDTKAMNLGFRCAKSAS